ncbi:MAG: alpha-ketoglutarate-dependent dioxygenase AlkB [Pseudohongiellaceae bacterium]
MQSSLFDNELNNAPIRHALTDAELLEYPRLFPRTEADRLLTELITDIPWRQQHLRIAGVLRAVPRLQCWMGDRSSRYGYSGMRLAPCPWNNTVRSIRDRVSTFSGLKFNSVLINYYRDGQDSVAWHADDETELGERAVIASVSLGAERRFQLKQKNVSPPQKYQLALRHGSLLIMSETMQQHWLHQLPKVKGLTAARVNLTFRNIVDT